MQMKKYHFNLLYIGDDDESVVVEFIKLINRIQGMSINTMSIEDVTEKESFAYPTKII